METAARYEVICTSNNDAKPTRTVTDAVGVTELARAAAATGSRLHVRPIPPKRRAGADEG